MTRPRPVVVDAPTLIAAGLPAREDLLNALVHPLICLDAQDIIRLCNSAAENLLNMSRTVLIGRALPDLLPQASNLLALISGVRVSQNSITAHAMELTLAPENLPIVDIQLALLNDMPDWVLIQIELRQSAPLLQRQRHHQSALRAAMGASMLLAHEIKNPLSGIRGAAQLLQRDVDAEGQQLTRMICTEVDRIAALIDGMQQFSDVRPLAREAENIHELIDHAVRVAKTGFARDMTLEQRYDPSLPPVWANRDAIIQLLLNLLKNAAEAASSTDGMIKITTAYRHGVRVALASNRGRLALPIEICVIDNGPGAPEEVREHLFEPFVTTKTHGSGLGLALAAKLVDDHGGFIEYDRQHGKTIMRILLPAAPGQEKPYGQ